MSHTVLDYLTLLKKEKEVGNLEKQNVKEVLNDINMDLLNEFLTNNQFKIYQSNEYYNIWRHPNYDNNVIFLTQKNTENRSESLERSLKLVASILDFDYISIIRKIFK